MKKYKYNLLYNEPPDGYRYLTDNEIILESDYYIHYYYNYIETPSRSNVGKKIKELNFIDKTCGNGYIRKTE